jgi:hypothetical protein
MKLPFDAFAAQDASAVPYGKFYYAGGHWHISVDANNGNSGTASGVILTGTNIGNFIANPFGQALYVAGDYKVLLMIDPTAEPISGKNAAALMVDSQGQWICYYRTGVPFKANMKGVASNITDYPPHRFQAWSAWLARQDGTIVGDDPLFQVVTMQ